MVVTHDSVAGECDVVCEVVTPRRRPVRFEVTAFAFLFSEGQGGDCIQAVLECLASAIDPHSCRKEVQSLELCAVKRCAGLKPKGDDQSLLKGKTSASGSLFQERLQERREEI